MSTNYNQLPLVEQAPGLAQARQELEHFVNSEALDELANLYDVELPGSAMERLRAEQKLADKYWDFRNGAERQRIDFNVEGELGQKGSPAWDAVFDAATKLGQVESSRPVNRQPDYPDYLVILGGANKAPDQRLVYGLGSVDSFGALVYMGSSRSISDAERQNASGYLPEAYKSKEKLTEYDLGCAAFETRLPQVRLVSSNKTVRNGDTWAWHEYEFEHNGETKTAFALNTPIEIHENGGQVHRATTYDGYRFFAAQAELASNPNTSVVAVTTGLYVPGQHLPAVQELTLSYGTTVETIGHSAGYSGAKRLPTQLLQEAKAGVDAAVRLQDAIAAAEIKETRAAARKVI